MVLREKILEIIEKRREIPYDELLSELEEHPFVVKKVLKDLLKENKISIERKRQYHKNKKFVVIVKAI